MYLSILRLQSSITAETADTYRTVIKNNHGRVTYLALSISGDTCSITDCFYLDRNQGGTVDERRKYRPKLLKTLYFPKDELLPVIEEQLDKKFFGIEYITDSTAEMSLEEYLKYIADNDNSKYRFLIMVGDGELYNGLPVHLRTRVKNKMHRSIYVELEYYKDGNGVVKQCYYYDRKYKRQDVKITPQPLISCFFPYSREGIINLLNNEICCNFNHMIITDGLDIDSVTTPVCGSL